MYMIGLILLGLEFLMGTTVDNESGSSSKALFWTFTPLILGFVTVLYIFILVMAADSLMNWWKTSWTRGMDGGNWNLMIFEGTS